MAGLKLGKQMRVGKVWMKIEAITVWQDWTDKGGHPVLNLIRQNSLSGI
jgi:hypothetical protein